MRRGVSGRRL